MENNKTVENENIETVDMVPSSSSKIKAAKLLAKQVVLMACVSVLVNVAMKSLD